MSRFFVLLCVILLPMTTAINVTNSRNQQEIMDIKKDLTMLRDLVISLNTSLISTQIDKDEKVKEINVRIQAQQMEMKSMNSTNHLQHLEIGSMNATIQVQQMEMRSMNSTIYANQQKMNASNHSHQQELGTMNATIQAQKEVERSMNSTIETQQKEIAYLISTVQDQQKKITLIESTIQTQQQIVSSINGTIQDQQHEIAIMETTIQLLEQDKRTLQKDLDVLRENNSAEIEHLKEADERGNQNYGAFQVIVQDLVTNVNTLRNTSQLQIGSINDNLTSLARQIHYTSLSFLDAQKLLNDLEKYAKETKINVSSIFNKLESQGQEMRNLQSETKINVSSIFNKLESQGQEMRKRQSETKINVSSIFNKLESQGQEMRNLQSERNRTYAFTVSTSSNLVNYNTKKIVYDKVITNIGGAYSSNTGIFTCPSPGTYVFTWSTMSQSDSQSCVANIYHNGNQLLMSYSGEGNGGYYEVASNTILLILTVGDRVWIKTETGTYCHGYPFTAFSGWKI